MANVVVVSPETASKLDQAITELIARLNYNASSNAESSYHYARALESAVNARSSIVSY